MKRKIGLKKVFNSEANTVVKVFNKDSMFGSRKSINLKTIRPLSFAAEDIIEENDNTISFRYGPIGVTFNKNDIS